MNPWSQERTDALKALFEEGLSAGMIARALGGVTRNAIIGKIHRLGLVRPGKHYAHPVKIMRSKRAPAVRAALPVAPGLIYQPAIPRSVREPVSKRLTLTELTAASCKWPHGDPARPDFHFCGHTRITGSPYCRFHHRIAFRPAVAPLRPLQMTAA